MAFFLFRTMVNCLLQRETSSHPDSIDEDREFNRKMPVFLLNNQNLFPPPDQAEENGLLAIGGDLKPERLIAGYRLGIFPWFSTGDPLLWWFTSPRLVLFTDEFKIPRRLLRYRKKTKMKITMDNNFAQVIQACADTRIQSGEDTWIVEEMQKAYTTLHRMGYAHSVESRLNGTLVGGLYGVAIGKVFFGESMFSHSPNASKFALIQLVSHLKKNNYKFIDCQMTTELLLSFGAREISGEEFQALLKHHIKTTTPNGYWNNDLKKEE